MRARIRPVSSRLHPALWLFVAVHTLAGAGALWLGVLASFANLWALTAFVGPLLLANGVGLALRREVFDRKLSRVLAFVLRMGGAIMLMAGAAALKYDVELAVKILGVSLVIALWGVAFDLLLDRSEAAFGLPD
jgi:hypothetical protein